MVYNYIDMENLNLKSANYMRRCFTFSTSIYYATEIPPGTI